MKVVYAPIGLFRLSKFGAEAYEKFTGLKVGYHDSGENTYEDCDIPDFCLDRSDEILIRLVQGFGRLMSPHGTVLQIVDMPDGTVYDIFESSEFGNEYIEG